MRILMLLIIQRLYNANDFGGPVYLHGLILISAWIINHMPSKVWGGIRQPFLNFDGCTVEV